MSTKPYVVTPAEGGHTHFTGIVEWRHHQAGAAHSLVRADHDPGTRGVVVVVSELASNPDDRGITHDFADVANTVIGVLREVFGPDIRQTLWIAHFGDFSYYDPTGPETFTRIDLAVGDKGYQDDRKGDVRLSRDDVVRLLGGWELEPVPEALAALGR